MMKYKKGKILYGQGFWKVRVVSDNGDSITYVALEGYENSYNGEHLTADKSMFKTKRT